jgi:hypothetical protein
MYADVTEKKLLGVDEEGARRVDFLVEEKILIELKTITQLEMYTSLKPLII